MSQKNEILETARSDFERLQVIHKVFVSQINRKDQPQSPVWSLKFVDGVLCVSFLDLEFRANRRSVAVDSRFVANEYAFTGAIGSKEHVLLCIYLVPDGGLYFSSKLDAATRICDCNNPYVINNIIIKLFDAAMSSPLFAPLV